MASRLGESSFSGFTLAIGACRNEYSFREPMSTAFARAGAIGRAGRGGRVARKGVFHDGCDDLVAGAEDAADGAADLRFAAAPAAPARRHLGDAQPAADRLDLHLGGPAPVGIAHLEP